jgi:hypothetical protein
VNTAVRITAKIKADMPNFSIIKHPNRMSDYYVKIQSKKRQDVG